MYSKKFYIATSPNQSGLLNFVVPSIVKQLLLPSLLIMLLCYDFLQPLPLFANGTTLTQALMTLEIHYQTNEASEVFLIWGVNGWQVVPEAMHLEGMTVRDEVMHTPMVREGDRFVAQIHVPAGTTIDYGFLITKTSSGATVEVWDANGEQDYRTVAVAGDVIEVQATPHLVQRTAIGTFDIGLQWLSSLVLLIGISLVLGIGAIYRSHHMSQSVTTII